MAKNTKTYILLGVVALIWGTIGYKVISGLSPADLPAIATSDSVDFKPKKSTPKDTFSITANYRDPFLGTVPKKKKLKKATAPRKVVPEIKLQYTGSIIGDDSQSSIFFVTIEGVQVLLKPKQTVQEVTLVSGSEQQIRIRHKGKMRTIPLKQ